MGLPSKRRTKTSKKDRASHFALKPKAMVKCSKCEQPVLPHTACGKCGYYKGKEVIKIEIKGLVKKKAQANKK